MFLKNLIIFAMLSSSAIAMEKNDDNNNNNALPATSTKQRNETGLTKNTFVLEGDTSITVEMPFPYRSISGQDADVVFEGSVTLLTPQSPKSYAVTGPLNPCFGWVLHNKENNHILTGHKNTFHDMDSCTQFHSSLDVKDPNNLILTIYSFKPSNLDAYTKTSGRVYSEQVHEEEMKAIMLFFMRSPFGVSMKNINRRIFGLQEHLGRYEDCPLNLGVDKEGNIFHTSFVAEDLYGLQNCHVPHPSEKGRGIKFEHLNDAQKWANVVRFTEIIGGVIIDNSFQKQDYNTLKAKKKVPFIQVPSQEYIDAVREMINSHYQKLLK